MSTILKRPTAYREKPRRLTVEELDQVQRLFAVDGLASVTSEFGFSTELQALQSVAHSLGMSLVDLSKESVDRSILEGFPIRLLHRHGIFPIDRSPSSIRIVVSNPFDVQAADAPKPARKTRAKKTAPAESLPAETTLAEVSVGVDVGGADALAEQAQPVIDHAGVHRRHQCLLRPPAGDGAPARSPRQIGRASCRERV